MKNYTMALLALLFAQQVLADGFYDQLCQFNYNWKKYADRAPVGKARFFTAEKELVAAHLGSVLTILRSNPAKGLSPEQYRSRMHLLGLLEGYRAAGRFPINSYSKERTPVFIDANNTYCAVAYLLQQTGQTAVAKRIAAANNLAWVKQIQDPALPVWQKSSGLSLEELKLIQGVYDFYPPPGYEYSNPYEVPQKPTCTTTYFSATKLQFGFNKSDIWCWGEGKYGILHGRWIQNFSPNMPWIIGFYENGKRSGQWKEYYPGTIRLCRTEHWENDKLNGIRTRYDRVTGDLIEEILFKDGVAVTKTNYDRKTGLAWVRQPEKDGTIFTKVFDANGSLLATGRETVNNPSQKLQWFQNIELTVTNSMALSTGSMSVKQTPISSTLDVMGLKGKYTPPTIEERLLGSGKAAKPVVNELNQMFPLVTYKKEGNWVYYRQGELNYVAVYGDDAKQTLAEQFPLFTKSLALPYDELTPLHNKGSYDSLIVSYKNDQVQHVRGNSNSMVTHLQVEYYPVKGNFSIHDAGQEAKAVIKAIGECDQAGNKIGVWKYYDAYGSLYKTESAILSRKDAEDTNVLAIQQQ